MLAGRAETATDPAPATPPSHCNLSFRSVGLSHRRCAMGQRHLQNQANRLHSAWRP